LGEIGFPTTEQEEWRFTNMAPLRQWPLHAAEPAARRIGRADIEPFLLARDGYCLVFVDGQFRQDLSTLPGQGAPCGGQLAGAMGMAMGANWRITWPATPIRREFFHRLNTAGFQDGAFVSVPANAVVEQPVQLLYLAASERPGRPCMRAI
jgi:Fe-S cluster assembly protein SufD